MTEITVKMNEPLIIICIQKKTFEALWNGSLPSKNLQEHREICDQANLEEDHGSH